MLPFLTPIPKRARLVMLHDVVMAAAAFVLSLYLRLGDRIVTYAPIEHILQGAALFALCAGIAFYSQRMYVGVWRYASIEDLWAILRGATLTLVLFLPAMFLLSRLEYVPRSMPLITWFVLLVLLGGPRFVYRLLKDRRLELRHNTEGSGAIPVLLGGSSDGAEMFIRALGLDPHPPYRVVGILAEKDTRVGRRIRNAQVLGTFEELGRVVAALKAGGLAPRKLILTKDELDGTALRDLLEDCTAQGLTLDRMPRLTDLRAGIADSLQVRPVALEDLLGRPQAVLDRTPVLDLVRGRTVLVTGAGGSIGSELVRQVAALGPNRLILADNSEFALYTIDLEMSERYPSLARRAMIADVRDTGRIETIFAEEQPSLVFHAAALKHVPMVEMNPIEGLRTNVLGTRTVAEACRRHGVKAMVLISSDKAVNPTNVMGASKRMAESCCQALDLEERGEGRDGESGTHYITVRFGNVLGSTGSVVPLFQRQLAAGGPLTVTHPEVNRFFMTIREAVELVLQAAALGIQGDQWRGNLFVLDMGEPVRIADLARQMIRLAGLRPDEDIEIRYTGLRPGEKLYEEIFHGQEKPLPTPTSGVLLAAPRVLDAAEMAAHLDRLDTACRNADVDTAREVVHAVVPEFAAAVARQVQIRAPEDRRAG